MAAVALQKRLAAKLGLDVDTVAQQVWPHLSGLKNAAQVQTYLAELLGRSKETEAFVRDYAALRAAAAAPKPSPLASRPPSQTPQQRSAAKRESEADFLLRLPEVYKAPLRILDAQIASLNLSAASTVEAPSKRQLKKGRAQACFCHARIHSLSPFTPLCPRCALPLCILHAPLTPCPSCTYHPILTTTSRGAHLDRLQRDRAGLLDRARDEMRHEPERFPDLIPPATGRPSTSATSSAAPSNKPEQPRVVLSLGKGKKVTRTTYTAKPAVSPTPPDEAEDDDAPLDPKEAPFVDASDEGYIRLRGEPSIAGGTEAGRRYARPGAEELYRPPERLDA